MANKTALYVLLAALALAALTNRWVAASGSRPGFNIVSFDEVYFGLQWIAFGLTLGGLALLVSQWRLGTLNVVIEPDKLTLTHRGETKIWSRATCGEGFSFKFAQATGDTIGFHPSAYKLHEFLDGPPIPSLYAICDYRVYAFLKLADGRLLTLRDPHREDVDFTYLTR